ncbi:hypothetical protein BV25DRAFT_1188053 [Artomyces pyxidatus]|uniref:Uncharacterized protein n=1 Tax=Artomyces pyxidatus TaxID=48021 RepID=A0ACB8SS45_9AGAM|nr:hypothetical protein BV25DRAFT_1188053 [Artomyces pyxidatus]
MLGGLRIANWAGVGFLGSLHPNAVSALPETCDTYPRPSSTRLPIGTTAPSLQVFHRNRNLLTIQTPRPPRRKRTTSSTDSAPNSTNTRSSSICGLPGCTLGSDLACGRRRCTRSQRRSGTLCGLRARASSGGRRCTSEMVGLAPRSWSAESGAISTSSRAVLLRCLRSSVMGMTFAGMNCSKSSGKQASRT